MITPRQLTMLRDLERDGLPSDYADFEDGGALAWRNRELVINALIRKGLVDKNDLKVTDKGRAYIQ